MFDLIIKNGKIIDGSGSPAMLADIAVSDGKIKKIGRNLVGAKEIIDATGLTVTPGFIDSHSHSDRGLLDFPEQVEKIEQGITLSIAGQCGSSPAPTLDKNKNPAYYTFGTFIDAAKDNTFGSSTAFLVGHSALRLSVIGPDDRVPTDAELEKMIDLLREGLEKGAIGLSFGLFYPPSAYAKMPEILALCKVVADFGGVVSAHIRDEGDFLAKSVAEFIEIVRKSGVRGVISHHKAMTRSENWGKVSHTLRMIEQANAEGVEIYCDVYPYVASHTTVSNRFIHKEYHSDGAKGLVKLLSDSENRKMLKAQAIADWGEDLSWVLISKCPAYPEYEGKFVSEIARIHGKDGYETVFDMIADSKNVCTACFFTMCEEDVETVMAYPRTMICTDSAVAGNTTVFHPRLKGTFPRVLGRYVRERKVTTLPDMIRKMTSLPAAVYGLSGKGLLREGFDADICIFDADKIIDRAEYADCNKRCEGLNYVIVGGKIAVKDSVFTGIKSAKSYLKK